MRRWAWIVCGSLLGSACMLGFDDSEVKLHPDASEGGTTAGGGTPAGGAAGTDASSGGSPGGGGAAGTDASSGGSPSGGGAAGTDASSGGAAGSDASSGGGTTGGTGGTTVVPTPCAVGNDDFGDGVIGSVWWPWGAGTTESGGHLSLHPDGLSAVDEGVDTQKQADFRECAVTVEVVQVLTALNYTNVYLAIAPYPTPGNGVGVIKWEEGSFMSGPEKAVNVVNPYDPVSMRWWRVNSSGGTTKYETSPEGKTWTTRNTSATPASWASCVVDIGAGAWQSTGTKEIGTALIDNFNF